MVNRISFINFKENDEYKMFKQLRLHLVAIGLFSVLGCTPKLYIQEQSVLFLDKFGLTIGYEIQINTKQKHSLNEINKALIYVTADNFVSEIGRDTELMTFYNNRDSIENLVVQELLKTSDINKIKIKEIQIVNLLLPQKIMDALISNAKIKGEPLPERLKPI